MPILRRSLLSLAVVSALPPLALAADPRMDERSLGAPGARVTVIEYFSLTCSHCAAFATQTMPQIRPALIDTGRVRFVFRDFPLDQIALTAAMVARALPAERYEPFITTLFASQDRWAFGRDINPTDEIWKRAALAGMSRATFDTTIGDEALKAFVLKEEEEGQQKFQIDSTPTFIINGQKHAGTMTFDAFQKLIAAA